MKKSNKAIRNRIILNDINLFLFEQKYPQSNTRIQFFSLKLNFNNFNLEKLLLNVYIMQKKQLKIYPLIFSFQIVLLML